MTNYTGNRSEGPASSDGKYDPSVSSEQRFTREHPCPVCSGGNDDPMGHGIRCYGFLSADGKYARCTRGEYAGKLTLEKDFDTNALSAWVHYLAGPCRCGADHRTGEDEDLRAPRSVQGDSPPAGPRSGKHWIKFLGELIGKNSDVSWIWEGYIARGHISTLTGLWKSGKTTLVVHLLKALEWGPKELSSSAEFCGRPVTSTKALIVSEQSEENWIQYRDEMTLDGQHHAVYCRPFLGRPKREEWESLIDTVVEEIRARKFDLVIFDSLPNLWGVIDENDAAQVIAALQPLHRVTREGAGVLLIMHPSKTHQTEGRATRGTGAIGGFVDILVEFRRYEPERQEDTRRVLTTYTRLDTIPETVINWAKDRGYFVEGSKAETSRHDRVLAARQLLPSEPPGLTIEEILSNWPTNGIPKPGERTLREDLTHATEQKLVERTGEGVRGNPHRYFCGFDSGPILPMAAGNESPSLRENELDSGGVKTPNDPARIESLLKSHSPGE